MANISHSIDVISPEHCKIAVDNITNRNVYKYKKGILYTTHTHSLKLRQNWLNQEIAVREATCMLCMAILICEYTHTRKPNVSLCVACYNESTTTDIEFIYIKYTQSIDWTPLNYQIYVIIAHFKRRLLAADKCRQLPRYHFHSGCLT